MKADTELGLRSMTEGFRKLLGVGPGLLVLGLLLEGLAIAARSWISFPIPFTPQKQIVLTILCVTACLLGMVWFNRTLNLAKVHLRGGEPELVTHGPFAYVRHPLYATLMLTIPPLFVFWMADLLFLIPWGFIIIAAHIIVPLEERGLIEAFGQEYERYRRYVPMLLPYKGAGGRRLRGRQGQ
jgi:protein-S-isoprenylcysteine O-methyltransferase Ste14